MDKKSMLEAMINHYTNGNKAKFATLLGVSAQTVSAWGARNTFDSELIYTKCRYLSSNWLLTGEGSMLRDNKTSEETTMSHSTEKVQSAPSDAVTLRLMDRLEEKDAKIDQLQSELRTMEKELAVFKSKHEHNYEHPPLTDVFTGDSSKVYGKDLAPMTKPTPSKRSSAGKI